MPFYPKHKLVVKYTPGNELIDMINRQPYAGEYIEASDGRYFSGTDKSNLGAELIKNELLDKEGSSFGGSRQALNFSMFKPKIKTFLSPLRKIPTSKPLPTEKDYKRGFFARYFVRRINGTHYIEISKKVYDSLVSKEGKYDHNLYIKGKINWKIKGNDIHKVNSLKVAKLQRKHPNLMYLFPRFDEYLQSLGEIQENLDTKDGIELYTNTGERYYGPYHIHPSSGPMVGSTHSEFPHDKLYYIDQLPEPPDTSYEDFIQGYDPITCYKCMYPFTLSATVVHIETFRSLHPTTRGCPEGSIDDYATAAFSCFDSDFNPDGNASTGTTDPNDILTDPNGFNDAWGAAGDDPYSGVTGSNGTNVTQTTDTTQTTTSTTQTTTSTTQTTTNTNQSRGY